MENIWDRAKDVVQNIKEALIRAKQDKSNGTLVVGGSCSVGAGVGMGVSAGVGIDNNGNIGLVIGVSTGAALPSASATGFISISNASDLKVLEGDSATIGMSIGEIAVFGGEVNIMPDLGKGNFSYALTGQLGFGVGVPLEFHGEYTRGFVLSFNIYDILILGCEYVLDR